MIKAKVKVKWDSKKAEMQIERAIKSGLEDACEYVLQESNKIAPFDMGGLTLSGNTDIEMGSKPKGSVYYDTPYAVRLHEHPEYSFQNGREGKYLAKTLKNEQSKVKQILYNKLGGTL